MASPMAARPSRRYEAWMVGPPTADHSHRACPRARSWSSAKYIRSGASPAITQKAAANGTLKRNLRRGMTNANASAESERATTNRSSSARTTIGFKVAEVDLRLMPQQQLKVTPKQIAANAILQLSSLELQDVINQELQENPALDLEEQQVCPLCGQPLPGRVCLNCFGLAKAPRQNAPETEPLEGSSLMQRDDEGDEFDPVVRAESEQTLAEWLSWNVRVLLPARLLPIAEYLIGNINESGYLDPGVTIEAAATTMKVSVDDAMRALRAIQSVEPWGIGARDVRECLLIQMEHLEEIGEDVPPHVKEIIAEHFRELGEHKFGDVAQALRVTRDEVQAAWDYIKDNLNPHPAHAFAAGPGGTSS